MKYTLLCIATLALLVSTDTLAQEWSAEQLEVWEFEKHCWQLGEARDFEARNSCFHEEYVGWYATDPVPMPYSEATHRRYLEMSRIVAHNMTPHTIMIYGNIAIVHLSGFTVEPGPDGKDKVSWEHWTDIVLKENGKWSWIADHGHPGPEN